MPSIPSKVIKGQAITASGWNQLIDYVRSMTPQPGSGVRITTGASGTTWAATIQRGGGGGKTQLRPFQVLAGTDESGDPFCTVVPGVVGTVSPLMSGDRLDAEEPPKLYINTFPLWLQVGTKLSTVPNDYRILVDKDSVFIFQDSVPHEEFKMTWTGPDGYVSGIGSFYVKIADITVTPDGDDVTIVVKQFLFDHIRSFVITADRVLLIS